MKAQELWAIGNEALYELWQQLEVKQIRRIEKREETDWFYDEIMGSLSYSYEFVMSNNAFIIEIETDGEYVTLSKLFVKHKSQGLGKIILEILRDYAYREEKHLSIIQVINPEFFSKFHWLERTGTHDFEFASIS